MSNPIFFLHEKLFAFARCNAAGDAPKPEVSLQEVRSILYSVHTVHPARNLPDFRRGPGIGVNFGAPDH